MMTINVQFIYNPLHRVYRCCPYRHAVCRHFQAVCAQTTKVLIGFIIRWDAISATLWLFVTGSWKSGDWLTLTKKFLIGNLVFLVRHFASTLAFLHFKHKRHFQVINDESWWPSIESCTEQDKEGDQKEDGRWCGEAWLTQLQFMKEEGEDEETMMTMNQALQ